ncbi:MAG: M23 family metallopeptidase [Prevotellaceae bacterium]|jgi:hypothetical protein|nr:M23 family metallopeptidase [Prevotellaceae bacterium]
MKKPAYLLLLAVALFPAYRSSGQRPDPHNAVELSHDFDQTQKRLTIYSNNKDFCDYHLVVSFIYAEGFEGMSSEMSRTVGYGKRQVATYRVRADATRYSYNYRYVMYRGNSEEKPQVDFIYSLPVVANSATTAAVVENPEGYQLAFDLPSDTVYASRGGVVCDDNLKDNTVKGHKYFNDNRRRSQVTVYHADGSFGEYVVDGTSLVYPGQSVKMGSPIASVKNTGKYLLLFSVYFLDKNKLKNKDTGNKHTHFRPFFQTINEGKSRLTNGVSYLCEYTDEMLMQDMSRRERKKFMETKKLKQPDEKQ